MRISIQQLDAEDHYEARNESGGKIRLDGSGSIGGLEGGLSPLQLLLAGVGACSAIDIAGILKKQRQDLRDFSIEVTADKRKKETWSEFESINVKYIFTGDVDPGKAERAIDLSLNKYCSVSKALEKATSINSSYEIRP